MIRHLFWGREGHAVSKQFYSLQFYHKEGKVESTILPQTPRGIGHDVNTASLVDTEVRRDSAVVAVLQSQASYVLMFWKDQNVFHHGRLAAVKLCLCGLYGDLQSH